MNTKYKKHGSDLNEMVFNAMSDYREVEINGHTTTMTEFFEANETLTREEKIEIINLAVGE